MPVNLVTRRGTRITGRLGRSVAFESQRPRFLASGSPWAPGVGVTPILKLLHQGQEGAGRAGLPCTASLLGLCRRVDRAPCSSCPTWRRHRGQAAHQAGRHLARKAAGDHLGGHRLHKVEQVARSGVDRRGAISRLMSVGVPSNAELRNWASPCRNAVSDRPPPASLDRSQWDLPSCVPRTVAISLTGRPAILTVAASL